MCVSWVECSPTTVLSVSNVLVVEANMDNVEIKYLSHGNLSDMSTWLGSTYSVQFYQKKKTYSVQSPLALSLLKKKKKKEIHSHVIFKVCSIL